MSEQSNWTFNGQPFTYEMSIGYIGFVYVITDPSGKMYVGKKIFSNKKAKPPLKGKTKRRISTVDSDWLTYYGSGPAIKAAVEQMGTSAFKREIIHLCMSKSEMGYLESKELFARDAIIRDDYYNEWVSARVQRNQLGKYMERLKSNL